MKKIILSIFLTFITSEAYATINAGVEWEVRTTGTAGNLNGGGFNTGASGIDYSQQDAAEKTNTDLVIGNPTTTQLTSAGSPFDSNDIGNVIHVTAGTGFTPGWYEITSESSGTITVDRAVGTAGSTGGTFYLGGAMSMASTLDDDFFEQVTAGNKIWVQSGTYTLGEAVTVAKDGTATATIVIEGYNSSRGDAPTGSNRPTFANGANSYDFGGANFWGQYNLIFTGTGVGALCGTNSKYINCKSVNSSTTANRIGFSLQDESIIFNCEAVSYRGYGIGSSSTSTRSIVGNYIHDCSKGIRISSGAGTTISWNIIASNVTGAIDFDIAQTTGTSTIVNNTLYGSENTTGIGFELAATSEAVIFVNNIINGFVTGINHATSGQDGGFDDYNVYNNNDTDATNWTLGPNSQTGVDPQFTGVNQVLNEGTVTAGAADNIVTDDAQDFTAEGVVAGQDYFYLVSGTNCTAGIYGITAVGTTTITLDLDPTSASTGSNIVYQITTGRDFSIGTNLKAGGFPGAFQAGLSAGYLDVGAVQREEPAGGGGSENILGVIQ